MSGNNGNGKEWWTSEKLFFSCQKCGGCCERKGVLFLTEKDIKAACTYLKMKEDTFKSLYCKSKGDQYFILNSRKRPCPMLNKDKTCRIQEAKPVQCKNYPFWPHIMQSKQAWNTEKFFCKGMNQGKEIDVGAIIPKQEVVKDINEGGLSEVMAIVNCGEHYMIGGDDKCRSNECMFSKDERLKDKIKEEGCQIYKLYLKLEKGGL